MVKIFAEILFRVKIVYIFLLRRITVTQSALAEAYHEMWHTYFVKNKSLLGRNHEFVPMALEVVVFRLLRDVQTVKLKLTCYFLFSFEYSQRNLKKIFILHKCNLYKIFLCGAFQVPKQLRKQKHHHPWYSKYLW